MPVRTVLFGLGFLAVAAPSVAAEDERFVEFGGDNGTWTYDLKTVKFLQPGRFEIIATSIDHPDVMKLKLAVTYAMRAYCTRPEGEYPPPISSLTLGRPDMPIQNLTVGPDSRVVGWSYPYKRLAIGDEELPEFVFCNDTAEKTSTEIFMEARQAILNGVSVKYVFDCKRGITGWTFSQSDDARKAMTSFVKAGTKGHSEYMLICYRVTGEFPDTPR